MYSPLLMVSLAALFSHQEANRAPLSKHCPRHLIGQFLSDCCFGNYGVKELFNSKGTRFVRSLQAQGQQSTWLIVLPYLVKTMTNQRQSMFFVRE